MISNYSSTNNISNVSSEKRSKLVKNECNLGKLDNNQELRSSHERKVSNITSRLELQKSEEQQPSWDPMKDEFLSKQNQVSSDYGVVRNEEYETTDGRRICKFFRSKGICYRGKNCEYLHIFTGSGRI